MIIKLITIASVFAGIIIVAILAAIAWLWFKRRKASSRKPQLSQLPCDGRFTRQNITHTFISAIPTLTREMNLEVATSRQTEVLDRQNNRRFLGINLGTNTAQIKVPVTYRYHIRLYDSWKLDIAGNTLMVRAPAIQSSLPPAIHTDQMEQSVNRGWCRLSPGTLLEELRSSLTPTLSSYASDPRRIQLVRETCRSGVAEFVKKWLESENQWGTHRFTAITAGFADEPLLPSQPVVHLEFD